MNKDEDSNLTFQLFSVALVSNTAYWVEQGFNGMYGSEFPNHPVNQCFDFEA